MKVHFLAKADRERYGIDHDDGLDVDLSVVMQDEAEELDEYGVDPDAGWIPFLKSTDKRVWRVIVWLALRRNGVDVKIREVKFDRRRVGYIEPESPGKDDSDQASETNESDTPPPSSPDTG